MGQIHAGACLCGFWAGHSFRLVVLFGERISFLVSLLQKGF